MPEEHPPLEKTFIQGYDSDAIDFPILGILVDVTDDRVTTPEDLSPHPEVETWPNHVFHGAKPMSGDRRSLWSYSIFPGPWVTTTRQDWDGATVTVKTRRNIKADIVVGETLANLIWTRNFYQQENDDLIATEINEARAVPGNAVIKYDVDDETFDGVTITTQLIEKPANFAALGNTAGTQVNYYPEQGSFLVGRKVSLSIGTTPTGRTETVLSSYTFPALVTGATISSLKRVDKNAKFMVNLNHIGARSRVVPHTVAITYGTYANRAAAAATLESSRLKLVTYDLNYQGVFFNVQAANVLTDSFSISAVTASDNPTWGVVTATYNVAESVPTSASEYIALVGGLAQVTSWSLKPWKYNLWRLESVSVVME
jgi:hypothetical protein